MDYKDYDDMQSLLNEKYYPLHVQNKISADYLDTDLLDKYFSVILETRKYVEDIWDISEKLIVKMAKNLAQETGLDYQLILCSTDEEFRKYLLGKGNLPPKEVLAKRDKATALLCKDGEIEIIFGKDLGKIQQILNPTKDINELKGVSAFGGKVVGKVKIIFYPNQHVEFQQGDILVTGMTRPDFLPIMKKARAVVTDSGGLLCHAAITARELKIPTIIGTQTATKVFKDGDLVEVDANTGTVRKI